MESLRLLDEVIKLEEDSKSLASAVCPFIYSDDVKSSSVIVGCQRLSGELNYAICMNDAIYLFQDYKVVQEYQFDKLSRCYKYLYLEDCILSPHPVHMMIMSNATLLICESTRGCSLDIKQLQLPIEFCNSCDLYAIALPPESLLYSPDAQTIKSVSFQQLLNSNFSNVTEVYKVFMGKLLGFEVTEKGGVLFCLYRHRSTGNLYVELAKYEAMHYILSSRHSLGSSSKYCIKKVDDCWTICVTEDKTWSFKVDNSPVCVKNLHASELRDMISLDIRCVDNKTLLKAFCLDGAVLEARFRHASSSSPQVITWRKVKFPSKFPSELGFATELFDAIYLVASPLKGLSLVNLKKATNRILFPFHSMKLFDGCCIPNGGTDLDSALFCGALTRSHGFIEKRRLHFSKDVLCIISSKKLTHSPIAEIWATHSGIVYESAGVLYKAITNERLKDWNGGIWLTEDLVEIADVEGEIVSLQELSNSTCGDHRSYSIIYSNGTLELASCVSRGSLRAFVMINLGPNIIDFAHAAAAYHDVEKCYYVASYHEYGYLSFWRNETEIFKYSLGLDFFVSDLLVKVLQDCCYTIATSTDARSRIFLSNSTENLLEVEGTSSEPFKLLDLDEELPFVLFYNEHESIMVNLASLSYGELHIGVRPLKLVKCSGLIYALDKEWTLTTIDLSFKMSNTGGVPTPTLKCDLYELPGSLALCLTLLPTLGYAIVVTRTSRHKQLRLVLFDYEKNRIIDRYETSDQISNALVKPFCDSSSDLFLQRFFLVCCNSGERSFFVILRIDNAKIVPLQYELLPSPVSTLAVSQDRSKVFFGGAGLKVYGIAKDYATGTISLRNTTFKLQNESLQVAIIPGSESLKCILPFGGCFEVEEIGGKVERHVEHILSDGSNLIRKTAFKRLNQMTRKHTSTSTEILSRFANTGLKNKESMYVIILESSKRLTLFYQLTEDTPLSPICCFPFNDPIINIVPVKDDFSSVQTNGTRLDGLPLFMIMCANGTVHTIVEPRNRSPIELQSKIIGFEQFS